MSTDNLSKTLYCLGVQCPKMLWLKKHRPELFDESVMNQTVLKTGNEVGDLAMGLFGDFTEVTYSKELSEMIAETQRLLAKGVSVIAEASFTYNGMFCSVDILKNRGSGRVELYEVKSSTEMKEIYFHDIAYQVYVLEKCGLTVEKAALVHIDSSYIRGKELEIEKLFMIEDVTEIVRSMQGDVAERTAAFKEMLRLTDEPVQCLGHQCFSPYDCGFWAHCTEELPEKNVFRISGMQTRTKLKNYNQGIISFEELTEKAKLNEGQRLQIEHAMQELPDHIDRENVREFLSALSYPLYFLDFETFQPAIPLYENSSPYEQIVFQYSLHSYDEEGGELKHREFLAEPGADPRRAVAERLCGDIPRGVCVLAYNMAFEKARIKRLAELYPDLAEHLTDIHDHIIDLMVPFQKKHYYTAAMEGSYSIKYVLPALFPDDPALDYHNLEEVHNGAEASAAFAGMDKLSAEEQAALRENMLKYCGLDTYAMVKVFEKLREV